MTKPKKIRKWVSRYMEKKWKISDKLIEVLLKEKGKEITNQNVHHEILSCMNARRLSGLLKSRNNRRYLELTP